MGVPTNMTRFSPPQSICDQSTIRLLLLLHDPQYAILNATLPDQFESSRDIRVADCTRSRPYGLQLLRAIDDYQKDCWAMCLETGQPGYRKRLGAPYDSDLDNGDDPDASAFARGLSPALTRLLACDSAGWFDANASAAARAVFAMCNSSRACAGLCGGTADAGEAADYQEAYQGLLAYADALQPDERGRVYTPVVVADLVVPIAQVADLSDMTAAPRVHPLHLYNNI
jgi:hypothetical protein